MNLYYWLVLANHHYRSQVFYISIIGHNISIIGQRNKYTHVETCQLLDTAPSGSAIRIDLIEANGEELGEAHFLINLWTEFCTMPSGPMVNNFSNFEKIYKKIYLSTGAMGMVKILSIN